MPTEPSRSSLFAGFHQVVNRIENGKFTGLFFCAFRGCHFTSTNLTEVAGHVVRNQTKA